MTTTENQMVPNPSIFYLNSGIYKNFEITNDNYMDFVKIHFFQGPFDCFCPMCKENSIFNASRKLPKLGIHDHDLTDIECIDQLVDFNHIVLIHTDSGQRRYVKIMDYIFEDKIIINKFLCTRNNQHSIEYVLKTKEHIFQKIGQFPSLADLQKININKYSKIITQEKLSELSKAIGLASHGVGIGSFIYLRRIFEHLIELAHETEKQTQNSWDDGKYRRAHWDQKIEMLKDSLPVFLVENMRLYGILSKGVHELSEDECIKNFEVVRLGIEMILDEKLTAMEKDKKLKEAKARIQNLTI